MISDGHNLMLNSREEYRLWLILKELAHRPYYFGASKEEQIIQNWIDSMFDAIEESSKNPYKTIEI